VERGVVPLLQFVLLSGY